MKKTWSIWMLIRWLILKIFNSSLLCFLQVVQYLGWQLENLISSIKLRNNLFDKIKWVCPEGSQWKTLNSRWIANKYEDDIRMNPTWRIQTFHSKVVNDLKYKVSKSMIYREMRKATKNKIESHELEFGELFDNANEMKKVILVQL